MIIIRKILNAIRKYTKKVTPFIKHLIKWIFFSWFMLGLCVALNDKTFELIAWIIIIITSPFMPTISRFCKFLYNKTTHKTYNIYCWTSNKIK